MSRLVIVLLGLGGVLACAPGGSSDGSDASTGSATTGSPTTTAGTTSGDPSTTTGSDETGPPGRASGTGQPIEPGPDTTVVAFDQANLFYLGSDPGQDQRSIDVEVEFPAAELGFTGVTLNLDLGCPNDLCDWWDRGGFIGVVEDAGTDNEHIIEVARFITPFRVGGSWALDVTHLRPLLSGTRTLRVHIDTWVGPGSANGDGWLVDASFDLTGGIPDERPIAVIPLWPEMSFGIGDPANAIADQVVDTTVDVPAEATRVELVSLITGHGQGNAENCAEFCPLTHGFLVGGYPVQRVVWRDDCQDNPINDQQGTWMYARAGWCPGADVIPWVEDVTAGVSPGKPVTVSYGMSDYENTCRPDAPTCTGCALGTGCDYDGGNHTAPNFKLSALLVAYE